MSPVGGLTIDGLAPTTRVRAAGRRPSPRARRQPCQLWNPHFADWID